MQRSERAPEASVGEALADRGATVTPLLMALDEIEGLRRALESRTVIGQAIGLVMAQERLTAEQGFAHLVRASSRTNVKLRDVAAAIVADADTQAGHAEEN